MKKTIFLYAIIVAITGSCATQTTKEYVDKRDAANLVDSKSYTDVKVSELARDLPTKYTLKPLVEDIIKTNIFPWALEATKPIYTPEEIGALPDTTVIPTKVSDIDNDLEFVQKSVFDTSVDGKMSMTNRSGSAYIGWMDPNIFFGKGSFVFGKDCKVEQYYCFASGEGTKALGKNSHSEGMNTTASGNYSHAEGYGTTASGNYSKASGIGTTSSGISTHAEGTNSLARGKCTHAEGNSTISDGESSHAEGYFSHAEGSYTHAEGHNTHAKGESTHAEGYETLANGYFTHAEGYATHADSLSSHAEGYATIADGSSTHAEGNSSHAKGNSTHAEGNSTIADGESTHAEGYATHSEGYFTHAEGYHTHASTFASKAEGINSQATNRTSFVWQGTDIGDDSYIDHNSVPSYGSHGPGTFNLNPFGGIEGFYIGEKNLKTIITEVAPGGGGGGGVSEARVGEIATNCINHLDAHFASEVLAVQIDTNTVAQIGELKEFFDGLPVGTVGTSLGGIVLALLAAVVWLKKHKIEWSDAESGAMSDVFRADTELSDCGSAQDVAIRKLSQLLGENVAGY